MSNIIFPPEAHRLFGEAYPAMPVWLPHQMSDHRLLTLEALAELAAFLPKHSVEYNAAAIPVGIAPEDIPDNGLSAAETIRSIEENGSWMVLKQIEQHPEYQKLLVDTLAEFKPVVSAKTGAMLRCEGFIFISSPNAVTPFHFDPEHNILLQLRGNKVMTVFPANDEGLVSPLAHEAFHMGEHHRNQKWDDSFAEKGEAFALNPHEAIYVPVKAPHWVKNGPQVSISLSITWRSEWSYAEEYARGFNHMIRKIGMRPKSPAPFPASNVGKATAYRVIRRAQLSIGQMLGIGRSA